jgi:hypothetical protein
MLAVLAATVRFTYLYSGREAEAHRRPRRGELPARALTTGTNATVRDLGLGGGPRDARPETLDELLWAAGGNRLKDAFEIG